jgi:hypothetical protein
VIPARVLANYAAAFRRSAASVRRHVLRGADHGLSEDRWRRAYGSLLARWLGVRDEAGVVIQARA